MNAFHNFFGGDLCTIAYVLLLISIFFLQEGHWRKVLFQLYIAKLIHHDHFGILHLRNLANNHFFVQEGLGGRFSPSCISPNISIQVQLTFRIKLFARRNFLGGTK